jgi:hypothetical protein
MPLAGVAQHVGASRRQEGVPEDPRSVPKLSVGLPSQGVVDPAARRLTGCCASSWLPFRFDAQGLLSCRAYHARGGSTATV